MLVALVGGYGLLLAIHGEDLWALRTYGPALSVPGGIATWGVAAVAAAVLMLIGTVLGREQIVGAGATLAMLWLVVFATMFAVSAAGDPSPVAQPGVLAYGCLTAFAALRAGVAVGRP